MREHARHRIIRSNGTNTVLRPGSREGEGRKKNAAKEGVAPAAAPRPSREGLVLRVIVAEERLQKKPGGWETALAVKDVLKKNSSGAVAPYTFYDEHYLKFCRSKLNDFEGMSWYLQGFGVVA